MIIIIRLLPASASLGSLFMKASQILEKQNGRAYIYEEAKEIGEGLVDFFTLLLELDAECDK